MNSSYKKFDVVQADLNPRKGHAQSGIRPVIVLQSNAFNLTSSTLIVGCLTSNLNKIYPSQFLIQPSKENGLNEVSRFLGSQLFTVDVQFILRKLGHLEEKYYSQLKEALSISLDWEDEFC